MIRGNCVVEMTEEMVSFFNSLPMTYCGKRDPSYVGFGWVGPLLVKNSRPFFRHKKWVYRTPESEKGVVCLNGWADSSKEIFLTPVLELRGFHFVTMPHANPEDMELLGKIISLPREIYHCEPLVYMPPFYMVGNSEDSVLSFCKKQYDKNWAWKISSMKGVKTVTIPPISRQEWGDREIHFFGNTTLAVVLPSDLLLFQYSNLIGERVQDVVNQLRRHKKPDYELWRGHACFASKEECNVASSVLSGEGIPHSIIKL